MYKIEKNNVHNDQGFKVWVFQYQCVNKGVQNFYLFVHFKMFLMNVFITETWGFRIATRTPLELAKDPVRFKTERFESKWKL